MGAECKVRPTIDSALVFACNNEIGRVAVPEMELQY